MFKPDIRLDETSQIFISNITKVVYPNKSSVFLMVFFAIVLSFSYIAVYWMNGTSVAECFWVFLGLTGILFIVLSLAAYWLTYHQFAQRKTPTTRTYWLICFAILMLSFGITLAANFPGTLSTDSQASIRIALGEDPLSNAHPMFYTALIIPFAQLGNALNNMNIGVFLFSLTQMTATAAICAYACSWLKRHGLPDLAILAVLAFFALNPVIAKYATTMWKDIPFALLMLLAFLQLFDIALSKGKALELSKTCLKLALITLLICLVRNNGIYAMALAALIMAIIWKRYIKCVLSVFIAIAIAYIITGPVYALMGIEPSPFRESVGIPIQQISAVVAYDGDISEEQIETLSHLVDPEAVKENYYPYSSNMVKYHESFNDEWLNSHQSEFMQLYFEIGKQNPIVYLQAWMRATQGYWNMETHDWVVSEGGKNLLYEITGLPIIDGKSTTQFTPLRSESPVSLLFNMGFALWATVFVLLIRRNNHQHDLCVPLIMYIGLWGTMLIAAPYYAEFRYMLPLHLALPLILATAFITYGNQDNDGNCKITTNSKYNVEFETAKAE